MWFKNFQLPFEVINSFGQVIFIKFNPTDVNVQHLEFNKLLVFLYFDQIKDSYFIVHSNKHVDFMFVIKNGKVDDEFIIVRLFMV